MAYPLSIASLHFQYKTAFDVLKAYMPDKNDDELSQMVLDFKTKKDADKPPKKAPTKEAESTPKKESKKESKKAPNKEAVTPPSDAPKKDAETTTETPAESPPSDAPKKESKKESKTKKPKV